jgi:hypothetical protein
VASLLNLSLGARKWYEWILSMTGAKFITLDLIPTALRKRQIDNLQGQGPAFISLWSA